MDWQITPQRWHQIEDAAGAEKLSLILADLQQLCYELDELGASKTALGLTALAAAITDLYTYPYPNAPF